MLQLRQTSNAIVYYLMEYLSTSRKTLRLILLLPIIVAVALLLYICNNAAECGSLCDYEWWKTSDTSEIEEALNKSSANLVATDDRGRTPLHHALSYHPTPTIIKWLLENGADKSINAKTHTRQSGNDLQDDKFTALHLAASTKSPEIIRLLLNHGADINAKTHYGNTPLHLAAAHNPDPKVTILLLEQGADPNAFSIGIIGQLAAKKEFTNTPPLYMFDPGGLIEGGGTPLHFAAAYNANPKITELLLEQGVEIDEKTLLGDTPLHGAAAQNSNPDVTTLLLSWGADPGAKNSRDQTPCDRANLHDSPQEIQRLLCQ